MARHTINDNFDLLGNSDLIDILPNRFMVTDEKKQKEIEDFFAKIPIGKVMRVRCPDESIWKLYSGRLRVYSMAFKTDVAIHSRKMSEGYFIYVKRKGVETDENMEIKSV